MEALDNQRAGKLLLGVTKQNETKGVPIITFREIRRNLPMK